MKALRFRLWLLAICSLLPLCLGAQKLEVDSVMASVFSYTQRKGLELENFSADLYLRYLLETKTKRKGWVMHYIPNLSKIEKGEHVYLGERHVKFSRRTTGEMDWKNIAYFGTMPRTSGLDYAEIDRFNLSIYSTNLFSDRVLSPLHIRNRRYYKYSCKKTFKEEGEKRMRIKVTPRFHNTQLVEGTIDVDLRSGAVRMLTFNYRYNLMDYSLTAYMGREGLSSLLPERISVDSKISLLGNKMHWLMEGKTSYVFEPADEMQPLKKVKSYDQTHLYQMRIDTTAMRSDKAYFDSIRPYPLTEQENLVYQKALHIDTLTLSDTLEKRKPILSEEAQDFLFDKHDFRLGKSGRMKLPAIVTPSMVQWSRSKGLMLQTKLGLGFNFPRGQQLQLGGQVGYNFKQRRVYWKVPLVILVAPRVDAKFGFEMGNNNDMYSSDQADDVRKKMEHITAYDSLINVFDNYKFYYYRDSYVRGQFSISPIAGLNLSVGANFHHRSLVDWNNVAAESGMQRNINSFSPRIHLEWTPAIRYYWKNGRRVLLNSDFPTFMLDYERGIKIYNCHSEYERWEMDVKYKRDLYALRSLYLRLGAGLYTNRGTSYFLDYEYFRDNNMPSGWEDDMSGQFQVLDSRWYNESKYYLRCCAAFESPMLLVSRIKYLSRAIKKERIYCNLLSVQSLVPYGEVGYGLSTHVVDVGAFLGMAKNQVNFGFKFSLRLFEEW